MRTNYALWITVLAIGAAVLICGCTGLPGGDSPNRTNKTPSEIPAAERLTADEVLARDGNFSAFVRALDAAGLRRMLAGPGPYTIFAPTDEAFSQLPESVVKDLFGDPKGNLAETLLYHMAPGKYAVAVIAVNETVPTVQGNSIVVGIASGSVAVDGARVVRADIPAANGVIHAIDAVMIPPDVTLSPVNETAVNATVNETTVNVTENVTG